MIDMIISLIIILASNIIIGIIAVISHELGHYMVARTYGANPKFVWCGPNPAVTDIYLPKRKRFIVAFAGTLTGVLSILLLRQYMDMTTFVIFIICMILGSHYDIRYMIDVIKEDQI